MSIIRYIIPLQSLMEDIYYYESTEQAALSNVSLQFRIDTYLISKGFDPREQYPHMKNKYKGEIIDDKPRTDKESV